MKTVTFLPLIALCAIIISCNNSPKETAPADFPQVNLPVYINDQMQAVNFMAKTAYAYLLLCADNSLYAGWTNDPEKRLKAHNSGKGSKYTRSRLPVKFALLEQFDNKSDAMKREAALKKMTHSQKLALVENSLPPEI